MNQRINSFNFRNKTVCYKKNKKVIVQIVSFCLCIILGISGLFLYTNKTVAKKKAGLNKTSITILVNHTYKLKVSGIKGKVTWLSSNDVKAEVDKKGNVKALEEGSVTVTAKIKNKKYSCKIKIVNYAAERVMAAYGLHGLKKILPKKSGLKIKEIRSGTYYSNKEFIYYDCTFKDKSKKKKHAYVHVYFDFGDALANHTATTKFYKDNMIVLFNQDRLDDITYDNRTSKLNQKEIKKIEKILFGPEKISVKKGADFDKTHDWLKL